MSATARRLWLLLLVNALLVTGALHLGGATQWETIVRPVRRFLAGGQQGDSWRPMQAAETYLSQPHERLVYDEMLLGRGVKFQYPLSSLLFIRGLSYGWLNAISWLSIVVMAAAVWAILYRTSVGTPLAFGRFDPAVGLAVGGLTVTFYPVIEAYSLGQIQAWINAVLAIGVLAWVTRREGIAGVAVGLAALLKPTYLLFGLWGLIRWRPRFVLPMGAVVAVGTLAAIAVYGFADNANYLSALSLIGRHGETFHPNQSLNGLLNRLLGNGDSLDFDRYAFAPFHPVVYGGTVAAFVTLMGLALWLPARWRHAGSPMDFGIAALTITMTSPVAWTHHYGVLLPVLAAAAPTILADRPFGRWTAPVLIVCYAVVSHSIGLANRLAGTPFGVLQSYVFIAAGVLLAMMYRWLRVADPHTVR